MIILRFIVGLSCGFSSAENIVSFTTIETNATRIIPGSSMEILPGLRHGDLSINHPQRYGRMLTEWIRR